VTQLAYTHAPTAVEAECAVVQGVCRWFVAGFEFSKFELAALTLLVLICVGSVSPGAGRHVHGVQIHCLSMRHSKFV
jgi:hypothetical protein